MLNRELLEGQLSELPLYIYHFLDPKTLEFTSRVRWICEHECPMYGKSWACASSTARTWSPGFPC